MKYGRSQRQSGEVQGFVNRELLVDPARSGMLEADLWRIPMLHSNSGRLVSLVATIALTLGVAITVRGRIGDPPDSEVSRTSPAGESSNEGLTEIDVRSGRATIDLGEWQPGTDATAIVRLRNDSKRSLEVRDIITNCGCTTAELKSKQIPAQGTVTLPVTLTAATIVGREREKEIVISFVEDHPPLRLTVRCRSREYLTIEPARILLPESGGEEKICVEIASVDEEQPFRILAIDPPVFTSNSECAAVRHELTMIESNDDDAAPPRYVTIKLDHPNARAITIELIRREP